MDISIMLLYIIVLIPIMVFPLYSIYTGILYLKKSRKKEAVKK